MKSYKYDFYKNKTIFFGISGLLILIGIIFNFIFGTHLDMQFTGGAIVKYSYSGAIDQEEAKILAEQTTGTLVDVRLASGLGENDTNSVSFSLTNTEALSVDKQQQLTEALAQKYPNGNWKIIESSCIDATMGFTFLLKCVACMILATILLVIYIAIRFKKIGGMPAAVMAIIALIHDIAIIYFTFIIARIPLNDNFIAVVLTILGYSLNDTIIIYDRIRENRGILGLSSTFSELLNISVNQTLSRSIYTSLTTFLSIAVVFVIGIIYNLPSIITLALPMMVGVAGGCYSSICIAGPLYVMWHNKKAKATAAA